MPDNVAHGKEVMVWQALAEMAATKAAADQEQAVFEAEWKQLTQIIERDRQQRVGALGVHCMLSSLCKLWAHANEAFAVHVHLHHGLQQGNVMLRLQ